MADASATLAVACAQIGVSSDGASLIRIGENALFRLVRDKIVVRIARNGDVLPDAIKEVAVASCLRDIGIPAAEPTDDPQPIMVLGRPVTFWPLIDDSKARPSLTDLAAILRQVHRAAAPPDLPLPEFSIFDRVSQRISVATGESGTPVTRGSSAGASRCRLAAAARSLPSPPTTATCPNGAGDGSP